MNEHLTFAQWVAAAVELLEYALADQNVDRAVQALTDIGRAEAALPGACLASAPEAADQREALRRLAGRDPLLFARAAANLIYPLRDGGPDGLVDSLYARSGYQVLLDLRSWARPPLDDFHLGEVDEELAEAVAEKPPVVPAGIPDEHRWWRAA